MTEDEMKKLASIITDMIFERQAELDEEFELAATIHQKITKLKSK